MTETARALLERFETLSASDQHELTTEILRRVAPDGDDLEKDLLTAADELFQAYDAEEIARCGS